MSVNIVKTKDKQDLKYHILDGDRIGSRELVEYERLLYQEFSQNRSRSWLSRNYLTIENNRYRSPIPYDSQAIYGVYENSKLISAITINFNCDRPMQFEKVGFKINKNSFHTKYCEALNFFICHDKHHHSFRILRELRNFLTEDLKTKNISFVLSTCDRSVLHLYTRFDWSVVKKKIIDSHLKYLILLEIEPNSKSCFPLSNIN